MSDPKSVLSRKDSFNNWSSDEDTNIMMNRMRAFFRTLINKQMAAAPTSATSKPPQLQAFEARLTKLMKTVPGINEDQVKEIVEYLSSEDTWSDSYDSSDYTSSDIDLETYGVNVNNLTDSDLASGEEFQKETALMYGKLMAKMQAQQNNKSPVIEPKVMHHISTKLVALMHDETPTGYHPMSKSVEDGLNDPAAVKQGGDVWNRGGASAAHGVHLSSARRGSLGQASASSSASGDLLDDERFSWKGSFESALAVGSLNKDDSLSSRPPVTSARFKPGAAKKPPVSDIMEDKTIASTSTNSLPRLGTSSIKKAQGPPPTIETSEATLELSMNKKPAGNIATSASAIPPKSARYRPGGFRPPAPARKNSPSSRKSSVDSVSRYTGRI